MADKKRVTIGDIQIYFDGDTARYSSQRPLDLAAIERELAEWQAFVERWLATAEAPPKVVNLKPQERAFQAELRKCVSSLRKIGLDKTSIATSLAVLPQMVRTNWPDLTEEQIQSLVTEAVAGL